ncbi:MAG: anti-anti-sigma regulatory factor [Polyangiales bacterium]|jgi:anti-anti-sigma regulatory factor
MQQISITENGQEVRVEIRGRLDEGCASDLHELLASWLKQVQHPRITIDLDPITGSTLLGRAKLIELQQLIKEANGRTAWVSRRPRFRGMALVVCHAAEDSGAKVVSTAEQVSNWLGGEGQRIEDAHLPVKEAMALVRARRKEKG